MVLTRLTLTATLLLAGCTTTQDIRPRERDAVAFAPWGDAPGDYRLGAGDRLRVAFRLTPELDEEVTVAPDGRIALKAAGQVDVDDLTLPETEAAVTRAALRNLRRPIVTAAVIDARSVRVTVGGQVRTPGVYILPSRASVMEMVTQAGGLLPESRMDQVVVIRPRRGAPAMLRTVDLRRFASRGTLDDNIALAAGDIVFVPRSRIAEAGLWVEQNITRLLPFSRSANYNFGPANRIVP